MGQLDDDLERSLDDYLGAQVPTEPPPEGGWADPEDAPVAAPFDEDRADRLLYRARKLRQEIGQAQDLYDRRVHDLTAWLGDITGGAQHDLERVKQSLEMFARKRQRDNPKAPKTLALPNGRLVLKKGRGKIAIQNEEAFVAWAKTNRPDLIRYEPKPKKSDLADELVATRVKGPQVNDEKTGILLQTYRLLVEVETGEVDPIGQTVRERVTVPGVVYTEPVQDLFDMQPKEEGL